ncbi:helix-turn-helix transcriptional regulator [Microbulbifer sp. VAAF005]|uniref:helix-turn-helix domain-containing protein n=1 Tax=Microbulbifer sp. VAAF005 TaxID=3034230 RepID=UPI0024ACB13B|nr:helix-turn-helix transcriptional regulator [Microbulbifer sp. VAAF005]WHI46791.1 helix-turn-helix transcriptional regulator [Microbulbifer sp. VAAF005]
MTKSKQSDLQRRKISIANQLRIYRLDAEITALDMAKRIKIPAYTLSKMETGQQTIPVELLPVWCKELGVAIDSVFQIEKPKQREERKRRKECESYVETFSKLSPEYRDLVLKHLKMVADIDRSKG